MTCQLTRRSVKGVMYISGFCIAIAFLHCPPMISDTHRPWKLTQGIGFLGSRNFNRVSNYNNELRA